MDEEKKQNNLDYYRSIIITNDNKKNVNVKSQLQ